MEKIITTANTRVGWQTAWIEARSFIQTETTVKFYVTIPENKVDEASDITNLRYYLPIANALNYKCALSISCSNNSDIERVNALFQFIQSRVKIECKISSADQNQLTSWAIASSDIFPVICVSSKSPDYSSMGETYAEYKQSAEKTDCLYSAVERYLEFFKMTEQLTPKEIIHRSMMYNAIIEYENKISSLAYIILIFIARKICDNDWIIARDDKNNYEVNPSIFSRLLADAETYAEGLYQIIENACLHSCGKCAFWGMRIFKASRKAKMSSFDEESQTRVRLYNKYRNCIKKEWSNKKEKTIRISSKNIFNNLDEDFAYFLEIYVVDDAVGMPEAGAASPLQSHGIVPHYNAGKQQNCCISSIRDIIEMDEIQYVKANPDSGKEGAYYYVHYGLRWFNKIVTRNNGLFMVLSPNGNGASCYRNIDVDQTGPNTAERNDGCLNDECIPEAVFSTEYNILIPLSYKWSTPAKKVVSPNSSSLFEIEHLEHISLLRELAKKWSNKRLSTGIDFKKPKIEIIDQIFGNIEAMSKEINENGVQGLELICINLSDSTKFHYIELIAKAIFKYLIKAPKTKKYIAIDFNFQRSYISEFVRVFTIFYDKSGKETSFAGNSQIAFCSMNEETKVKEVNFLLAGDSISSVYATANVFAYYNSESTLEFIPLLKYLADYECTKGQDAVSQFPYDLILSDHTKEQCYFLERMNNALNTDIREKEYGCKISNVHVRISSRIHLQDFYEAELLFHNIGNIYRFAYLISSEILFSLKTLDSKKNKILIVGYENYSSILIQQVSKIIGQATRDSDESGLKLVSKIYQTIATTEEDDVRRNRLEYLSEPLRREKMNLFCFTIIPIGTTMSTIYKIHSTVDKVITDIKKTGILVNYIRNFAVIAVNSFLLHDGKERPSDDIDLIRKYWDIERMKNIKGSIVLRPQKNDTDGGEVSYLLAADSRWYDAEICQLCEGKVALPLIQVDKTSTLPAAIFRLHEHKSTILISENNLPSADKVDSRIKALQPSLSSNECHQSVIYSHIYRGNNHYQFYFDFQKLTIRKKKEIESWAKRQRIEPDAFNVVLSPLNITNSLFLKIIIDTVFSSSLRFLHIDITNTYKEDARTKFKYISQEFMKIRRFNPNAAINFYYIDDSIVTGQTLQRGKMLMRMLLEESGIEYYSSIVVFKKIFLLINRNSFETINNFVDKPVQNLHAYINLFIPSYNTNNNFCPGCKIQERYDLLRKRSANPDIAKEFARLSKKHEKRTPAEYEQWLECEMRNNHSYFAWLKLWLCYCSDKRASDLKICELKKSIVEYIKGSFSLFERENNIKRGAACEKLDANMVYYELMQILSQHTFDSYIGSLDPDCREQMNKVATNLMKYIVSERAYLRLTTMNTAYYELLYKPGAQEHNKELAYNTILFLLSECCKDKADEKGKPTPDRRTMYEKFEKIESYIKVISREHLANYYHIRWAITEVMHDLLNILLEPDVGELYSTTSNDYLKQIIQTIRNTPKSSDNPCAYLQYQLFCTLVNRLAMLQSPRIYNSDRISEAVRMYSKLLEKYRYGWGDAFTSVAELQSLPDDILLTEMPSDQTMLKKYILSIKTASMLTNDDTPCFRLLRMKMGNDNSSQT